MLEGDIKITLDCKVWWRSQYSTFSGYDRATDFIEKSNEYSIRIKFGENSNNPRGCSPGMTALFPPC